MKQLAIPFRKPSVFTLDMARARAKEKGLTVSRVGYNTSGRRVVFVHSQTGDFEYPLTHTEHGFVCPCSSFKNRQMCTHFGSVVNHLEPMTMKERTAFLKPDVEKGKALAKHLRELAEKPFREAA